MAVKGSARAMITTQEPSSTGGGTNRVRNRHRGTQTRWLRLIGRGGGTAKVRRYRRHRQLLRG